MVSKAISGVKRPVLPARERERERATGPNKDDGVGEERKTGGTGKEKSVNYREIASVSFHPTQTSNWTERERGWSDRSSIKV